ncbi:YjfA family protein [Streptomyces sp. RS10V-4]|uniref:DUF2690 domain-containing protein n=1 Tax=Streptomyces rhizoryzae TaxID=2932493 RepID=UPI002003BA1C|nr:DUF2690 domain-containing protein [Streptomyces rhizoryzae]MCK7621739.1 YjfA family protein [Streptomyces rhizoryzae]
MSTAGTAAIGAGIVACGLLAALLLRFGSHGDAGNDGARGGPDGTRVWPWALHTAPVPAGGSACTGRTCLGQDPYREKCDRDGATLHALNAYGHQLRLRYSRACQSAWAEVEPARGTARLVLTAVGRTAQAASGGSRTDMVAAGQLPARACVEAAGHQLCVTEHDSWLRPVSGHGTR